MKAGGHHWAYDYNFKVTFIVVPRRKDTPLPAGWKQDEYQHYEWKNCFTPHTAGAWEGKNGKLYIESARVHDNVFQFFPAADGRKPNPITKADFVRFVIDPIQPSGSAIPDPQIILDSPCDFPNINERFMTQEYEWIFSCVWLPNKRDMAKNKPSWPQRFCYAK